jgi:DNA processing protein
MTGDEGSERRGRVTLSFLATPGDLALGAALRYMPAAEVLAAVTGTDFKGELALAAQPEGRALIAGIERWRRRLGLQPSVAKLAEWQDSGLRLICPGDTEWPSQLDDLGDARPVLLWARGKANVRFACLNSVAVVGARAATAYGNHVALEMAAALTEAGVTVISGGA